MKKLKFFSIALGVLVFVIYAVKVYLKTDYTDFDVYYRAVQRLFQNQDGIIYSLDDGTSPFRYSPLVLFHLIPLGFFSQPEAQSEPQTAAKLVWFTLQFGSYALGFYFLYRSLKLVSVKRETAYGTTLLTSLMVLRFCLDSFTIGQITGVMFFGFTLAIYGVLAARAAQTPKSAEIRPSLYFALGVLIPAAIKISPGFLIFSGLQRSLKFFFKSTLYAIGIAAVLILVSGLALKYGFHADPILLWKNWIHIIGLDDQYYDASHYGSQSLKSALLRLQASLWIWKSVSVFGIVGLLLFWLLFRPMYPLGLALSTSLGIFPYLLFMPETFKYALTALAIPIVFLLVTPHKSFLTWFALGSTVLFLSLAGKDLMPDALFFGLQQASVPFGVLCILGMATFLETFRLSKSYGHIAFEPWESPLTQTPTLEHSFVILCPNTLNVKLTEFENLKRTFAQRSAEFVIHTYTQTDAQNSKLKTLHTLFPKLSGKLIHFVNPELLADPEFYERTIEELKNDPSLYLIRGSRRLPESRFRIPVKFLPLIYRRQKLGDLFHWIIRKLTHSERKDYLSGNFSIRRELLKRALYQTGGSSFLFELELSFVAEREGVKEKALPLTTLLVTEKSIHRVLSECLSIATGLVRILYRRGLFLRRQKLESYPFVTADDWGMTPAINKAILELAKAGLIKRISILASTKYLDTHLDELLKIPGLSFGIHYNLTYRPGALSTFQFLVSWLFKKKDLVPFVRQEFLSQMQILESKHIPITYLDGHEHIHLVPYLLASLEDLLKKTKIRTIRAPLDWKLFLTPKMPVGFLAFFAKRWILAHGYQTHPFFYPKGRHFASIETLTHVIQRHSDSEILIHPASTDDSRYKEAKDGYSEGRVQEYKMLIAFTELCKPL